MVEKINKINKKNKLKGIESYSWYRICYDDLLYDAFDPFTGAIGQRSLRADAFFDRLLTEWSGVELTSYLTSFSYLRNKAEINKINKKINKKSLSNLRIYRGTFFWTGGEPQQHLRGSRNMTERKKSEQELKEQQEFYEKDRADFTKSFSDEQLKRFEKIEQGMRNHFLWNFYPVPDPRNATTLAQAQWNVESYRPEKLIGGNGRTSVEFLNKVGRIDCDDIIIELMGGGGWSPSEGEEAERCESCDQTTGWSEYELNISFLFEEYWERVEEVAKADNDPYPEIVIDLTDEVIDGGKTYELSHEIEDPKEVQRQMDETRDDSRK